MINVLNMVNIDAVFSFSNSSVESLILFFKFRTVAIQLASALGIKEEVRVRATHNPTLESYFRIANKNPKQVLHCQIHQYSKTLYFFYVSSFTSCFQCMQQVSFCYLVYLYTHFQRWIVSVYSWATYLIPLKSYLTIKWPFMFSVTLKKRAKSRV